MIVARPAIGGRRCAALVACLFVLLVPSVVPAAETPIAVNLATIATDIGGEAYYAKDMGFFTKAGLDVTITPFQNGAQMAAAVVSGAEDIGFSNGIALSTARERGLAFTIVAPANMHVDSAPTTGIIAVLKTSSIGGAKDLAGKTIAVGGLNQIADTATKAWIDKNGGDSSKSRYLEMPLAAMSAALQAGRIDVAVLDTNNDVTHGKADDPLRRIGSSFDAISPRFIASMWFTSADWAAKHPAAARAFVQAMHETATWANSHHRESAQILAKYTGEPLERLSNVQRVTYGERVTDELVQPEIDAAAKYGLIKSRFPAADIIYSGSR